MITIVLLIAIVWLLITKDILHVFKLRMHNGQNSCDQAFPECRTFTPILNIVIFSALLFVLGTGLSVGVDRQILNYVFKINLPKFKDLN